MPRDERPPMQRLLEVADLHLYCLLCDQLVGKVEGYRPEPRTRGHSAPHADGAPVLHLTHAPLPIRRAATVCIDCRGVAIKSPR